MQKAEYNNNKKKVNRHLISKERKIILYYGMTNHVVLHKDHNWLLNVLTLNNEMEKYRSILTLA